jgi:hypothetical protein
VLKIQKISVKHYNHRTSLYGINIFNSKKTLIPAIKSPKQKHFFNPLAPAEIISTFWEKWNEPDIIRYKAISGIICIIYDENLLRDISEFNETNCLIGSLPYLHIEGEHGREAYHAPENSHILEFLREFINNYDIYTTGGKLLLEANNEKRKLNLCVECE